MRLAAGQTLSCYEVLGPLGAGAMGEVYRARDTRLGREVAIKVLPGGLADDAERLRRFQREARTLASVNHPNIAGIYDVNDEGDLSFIALELVPGEDLAARLSRRGLPLSETLDVCRQIAEGLEAAHEAGVVHRDLKPGNVRVTPDGVVKILDFGLAKAACHAASSAEPDSFQISEAGLVLGTPAYMSPEQARGRPVDRRADVWAFGCMLYECLTGAKAFRGESVAEILAAVLEGKWDRSALPAGTPADVRELLERCLELDPRQRLRDVGEARIRLERGPAPGPAAGAPSPRRGLLRTAVLALAALGIGALAGGSWFGGAPDATGGAVRPLRRLTELVDVEEQPAISPDEKYLAFVARVNGERQIFRRLMAEGAAPLPVTEAGADHSFPRWIDENTLIYFRHPHEEGEDGSLWRTLVMGSKPRRIGPAAGEADVSRSSETIATFRAGGEGPALILVDLAGERPERAIPLPAGIYGSPRWSPEGRYVAFQVSFSLGESEIQVMEVQRETVRTVATAAMTRGLAWLPDGSGLVYSSSAGSTMAYPPIFSLRTVRIDGGGDAPLPQTDVGYASYVEPEVTSSGRLVASRVRLDSDIWMYPVSGSPVENVQNARRITEQTGLVQVPSASPVDERVAYLSDSGGHANIWVARVDRIEPPRPITFEQDPGTMIGLPEWSPRGDWIAYIRLPFSADREECLVSPEGIPGPTLARAKVLGSASWSHDGEWLYYFAELETGMPCTYKVSVDGGPPELVRSRAVGTVVARDGTGYFSPSKEQPGQIWKATPVGTGEQEQLGPDLASRVPLWPHEVALSPDGDWLAMPLLDDGTTNLWRMSTKDGTLEQVTDFGQLATMICRQVSWSRDGGHIFAALMEIDADVVLLEGALR